MPMLPLSSRRLLLLTLIPAAALSAQTARRLSEPVRLHRIPGKQAGCHDPSFSNASAARYRPATRPNWEGNMRTLLPLACVVGLSFGQSAPHPTFEVAAVRMYPA